jgi:hypothetical protein
VVCGHFDRYAADVIKQTELYSPEESLDFAASFNVFSPTLIPSASSYPHSNGGVVPAEAWRKHDSKMIKLIEHYGDTTRERQLVEGEIRGFVDVGTDVEVYWAGDKRHYAGRVTECHENGTYSIEYNDESKPPCSLRQKHSSLSVLIECA